jgi:hypothetical protein
MNWEYFKEKFEQNKKDLAISLNLLKQHKIVSEQMSVEDAEERAEQLAYILGITREYMEIQQNENSN